MKKFACLSLTLTAMVMAVVLSQSGVTAQQNESQSSRPAAAQAPPQGGAAPQYIDQDVLPARLALARNVSYNYLAQHIGKHGIGDINDLKPLRVEEDQQAMTHTHVQQTFQNVPVFGGEAIVHLNADQSVSDITDSLVSFVKVNTQPTLTAKEAVKVALRLYGCSDCLTEAPRADLWVMRRGGRDHLVYRVQMRREDGSEKTAMPVYFIDAHTGAKVWNYDNLQSGTGVSLYSGQRPINTWFVNFPPIVYYMEDHIRRVGTYDGRQTTNSSFYFTDADNLWNGATQRAGVDAHFGTSKVLDYYKSKFGRNGLNGTGGPTHFLSIDGVTRLMSVTVHYGNRLNNGFWNSRQVVLGDGDGIVNGPNVSVDWLGHEWTHALTENTARLVYSRESGALNESWSDVFGCMIERYTKGESVNTWKVFEQTLTPGVAGDAERFMNEPHLGRNLGYTVDDQPDHYLERYLGTQDNGGVHINSGIPNKVFYLVAKGGTHHRGGSMTGIGPDAAAAIWYRALTAYMTSTTNFKGARTATLKAATALHGTGSVQYNAVAKAWTLCGVN
ncbi:MAG: M4 family metallopeptidase [Pyrinomonadaceae bacterium]